MRGKIFKKEIAMENSKSYKRLIKLYTPRSPLLRNSVSAFLIGGSICLIGELLARLYSAIGATDENSYLLVTVTLIFLSALLTTLGVYDNLARVAGAGTLVPVTGFANSVVSEALDTRSEGYVLGVGAKIFTVAGPVILYGILSGMLYGLIYYLFGVLL